MMSILSSDAPLVIMPFASRIQASQPGCFHQPEAIELAKEMNPEATIHVERVRNTEGGQRDKWRSP